ELSLHNWIKPVFEFGVGTASYNPGNKNFTYHSPLAPFFKIGVNYNFLYNSNPDYQFMCGLRYGITSTKFNIDATSTSDYWQETIPIIIPSQTATVGYGEFHLGLRVKIWSNISMGWSVKYHFLLHQSRSPYGRPWYIPGYGTRGAPLTGAISVMYTLPLNKYKNQAVDTDESD
ncbi:MAG: hypothetical protein K2M76_00365, partial [Muribaculaceae bacterium]|nr:hypothetical protein [Muribaculaceae bacterium]